MINGKEFVLDNGRFKLTDKPKFNMTASALKQILVSADLNNVQPEEGTNYTQVGEDITEKGATMTVHHAYVQDGTDGVLKHSIRLQNKGEGRENPPTLISFARFNDEEANMIVSSIQ